MTADPTLFERLDPDTGKRLVSFARETVASTTRSDDRPPAADGYPDPLAVEAGAFVTIERGDRLRGCCGRVRADRPLAEVVRDTAIDAAENDPRCRPVRPGELDDVTHTVTVLSPPTALDGSYPDAIEVGRDGLIVSRGRYRGLLLPQVATEHGWDERSFLTATCQKAGLPGDAWRRDGVDVQRFTARAYEETAPRGEIEITRFDRQSDDDGAGADGLLCQSDDNPDHDGDPVPDGGRPGRERVRPPAVAGKFYPGRDQALRDRIESSFSHEFGPGPLGELEGHGEVTALVSPHAGYRFSGPVAAHGYAALATGSGPETVVVLGPNHEGVGADAAVAPQAAWETPLGPIAVDRSFAERLVEDSDVATFDAATHQREHSVEVQIPFLQYCLDGAAVVPICLTRLGKDGAERLGRELAAVADRTDTDIAVVSSTDLTHHVPHEQAAAADEPVVEAITALDTAAIASAVQDGHSMCGPWATIAGVTAAAELGATDGECLQYATSGQTAGPVDRVVGYCSAVF